MRRFTALSLAGVLLIAPPARAQRTPDGAARALTGIVRDSVGARLPGARLHVVGTALLATSDDSGTFRLAPLPAGSGRLLVEVRRLGYEADTLTIAPAERAAPLTIVLTALPTELAAVAIAGERRGKLAPFERRRVRGVGTFITREEIERAQPSRVSDLLRHMSGVYVGQDGSDQADATVAMRRTMGNRQLSPCEVQLYVDGQHYPGGSLDDFAPVAIEAIEVYRSASEIPADFRTRDATCGVIALWTRDPAAVRGKPPAHP